MTPRARLHLGMAFCGAALAAVVGSRALGVSLVAEWFYLSTWVPTLLFLELLVLRLGGEPLLLRRPRDIAHVVWWSAVIWLVFEAANLRLQNWYYVYAPESRIVRWPGAILAFGTVVPVVLLPARVLERAGWWQRLTTRPITVRARDVSFAFALGWVLLAAVLAAPRLLFPFLWGAVWLVVDPILYRLRPEDALIGDLARGRWGRIARLLTAGLVAGGLWEGYNAGARTGWIYTVPWLEEVKLFEMPPLGFLGFPFLALEVWSMYRLARVAGHRVKILVPSVIFAVVVLAAMDRWTVSSTAPRLAELPGIQRAQVWQLAEAGLGDVFRLARTPVEEIATRAGLAPVEARPLWESARLAALRGIGTEHAAALVARGFGSVEALAAAEPAAVWRAVGGSRRPTPAEVRVWVRAAREQTSVLVVGGNER